MTDRPILFSAPMVRAHLDGRKTMTRRALYRRIIRGPNNVIPLNACIRSDFPPPRSNFPGEIWTLGAAAKYRVGDRFWVRETWQGLSFGEYVPTKHYPCDLRYFATDTCADLDADVRGYAWRPSIFMPRWASRLTDTVTAVRIERLQDITEGDAIAEGIDEAAIRHFGHPIAAFAALWNSVAPCEAVSWEANPWVVATTFTVGHHNIDAVPA